MSLTIQTRYYGATNTRGARIQATPSIGKAVSISYPYELSGQAVHNAAVRAWLDKFGYKDKNINFEVGEGMGGGYIYVQALGTVSI